MKNMDLKTAFRADKKTRLAVVGAGGKSSTMFMLARSIPGPVITTASTHLSIEQPKYADVHIIIRQPSDVLEIKSHPDKKVILVTGEFAPQDGRVTGLSEPLLNEIKNIADQLDLPLILEADGSKRLPLKAPAAHEPAIPDWANYVAVLVGLSGIGTPLDEFHVHRPEIYSHLSGLKIGQPVNIESLEKVLLHPSGGLKNIPTKANKAIVLNQADSPELIQEAIWLSKRLTDTYDRVIITSLKKNGDEATNPQVHQVTEKNAAVILAAGEAKRFGEGPKVTLQFQGKPLIRHLIDKAIEAEFDEIVVVLGAFAEEINQKISDLPIKIVFNDDWQTGISSSIQRGIESLHPGCGSVMLMQADQPATPLELINKMIECHQKNRDRIIAPWHDGHWATPVLFDREMFEALKALKGDVGGRVLFKDHTVTPVEWPDPMAFKDIDTLEDYINFIN
jgi:molybdenum cofactor cytidylyltransferase